MKCNGWEKFGNFGKTLSQGDGERLFMERR
jgi:hypothetical protein